MLACLHDHKYVETNNVNFGKYDTYCGQICSVCGLEYNIGKHDFTDPTCKAPATCTKCSFVRPGSEVDPNNHACQQIPDYDNEGHFKKYGCNDQEIPETREAHTFTGANCQTEGVCVCGATGSTNDAVHVGEAVWNHNATQHWQVYSTCGHETEKTNHKFENYTEQDNDSWIGSCVCGATDTIDVLPHDCEAGNEWLSDGVNHWNACTAMVNCPAQLNMEAHDKQVTKQGTPATCEDTGLTDELGCPICEFVLQEQTEIANLGGHEWNAGEVTTEATETEDGVMTYTCTRENCGATRTEPIPATGTGGTEIEDPDVPLGGDPDDGGADDGAVLIDEPEVPLAGLMTRAEFVNYLYVQAGSPDAQASTFADVAEDHEYAAAIGWAQANGIAKGITENEFAPDEIVSVDQAHLFLVRYAQFMGVDMPELAALAGKDPLEILDNADEVLAEFFAAISPKEQAA